MAQRPHAEDSEPRVGPDCHQSRQVLQRLVDWSQARDCAEAKVDDRDTGLLCLAGKLSLNTPVIFSYMGPSKRPIAQTPVLNPPWKSSSREG